MTKEELLQRMRDKRDEIPANLPVSDYLSQCVEAMFDVAAEVLADPVDDGGDYDIGAARLRVLQGTEKAGGNSGGESTT